MQDKIICCSGNRHHGEQNLSKQRSTILKGLIFLYFHFSTHCVFALVEEKMSKIKCSHYSDPFYTHSQLTHTIYVPHSRNKRTGKVQHLNIYRLGQVNMACND